VQKKTVCKKKKHAAQFSGSAVLSPAADYRIPREGNKMLQQNNGKTCRSTWEVNTPQIVTFWHPCQPDACSEMLFCGNGGARAGTKICCWGRGPPVFTKVLYKLYEEHDKMVLSNITDILGQVCLMEHNSGLLTWRKLLLNRWHANNICSINILIR